MSDFLCIIYNKKKKKKKRKKEKQQLQQQQKQNTVDGHVPSDLCAVPPVTFTSHVPSLYVVYHVLSAFKLKQQQQMSVINSVCQGCRADCGLSVSQLNQFCLSAKPLEKRGLSESHIASGRFFKNKTCSVD